MGLHLITLPVIFFRYPHSKHQVEGNLRKFKKDIKLGCLAT